MRMQYCQRVTQKVRTLTVAQRTLAAVTADRTLRTTRLTPFIVAPRTAGSRACRDHACNSENYRENDR